MSDSFPNITHGTSRMDQPAQRPDDPFPRLALRPREAAQALGISERLLWRLTNQGDIPHLRLGLRVVYPVDALQKWLADHPQKKGGGP